MPKERFELSREYSHYALNVARLPFRHLGLKLPYHTKNCFILQISYMTSEAEIPENFDWAGLRHHERALRRAGLGLGKSWSSSLNRCGPSGSGKVEPLEEISSGTSR